MDLTHINLPEIPSNIVFIISGLSLCLFGSILFRFGTRLVGLGLGMGFGFFLGEVANTFLKTDQNLANYILLAFSIIGAIASLFIIKSITNFIFAILGFLFGLLIGRFGLELYSTFQNITFEMNQSNGIIIIAIAAISAVLAVLMQRYIMIFVSSYIGSTFLVSSVDFLANNNSSFIVVVIFSILWQAYILGRLFREKKRYTQKNNES